jgi:hypothetical protein
MMRVMNVKIFALGGDGRAGATCGRASVSITTLALAMATAPVEASAASLAVAFVVSASATAMQDSSHDRTEDDRSARVVRIGRLGPRFVLDGFPDEAAWDGAARLPLVTYEPAYRQEPTERTEILVAHDDTHLYVAGRMYETDPTRIRGNSLQRDRWSGDDRVGILVDPFDDNETGLWFWTTPEGVRGDALVTGDGGSVNDDWNTHWEVAVQRTDRGWFAELRIPLSSLGFQESGGQVIMGMIAHRDLSSRNERHVFPDIAPESTWRRPSLALDVVLEGVESHRPLYVSPFVLAGTRREAVLASDDQSWEEHTRHPGEVGADLRYPISPNLTLDLTVNTDFAQVEVDDQQVNLTRFDLFFPEKRQFFLERAGTFSFATGGADRLFHSRRIGLDGGSPVRILSGVRLAGRVGDWDVGLLDLETEGVGELASTNHGVVRLRRRILNQYSTVGGMVTTRLGSDGSYNVAYGLDGRVRIAGDDYVGFEWAQTFDDSDRALEQAQVDEGRDTGALDGAFVRVRAWRAAQDGFTYTVAGRFAGPRYQPEMGFQSRRDFTEVGYAFAYAKIFGEGRVLRRVDPFQLFGNVVFRNVAGSVESAQVEYDTDITWKSGWSVWQDFELYYDDLAEALALPRSTFVPVGSYTYFGTEGGFDTPPGQLFRGGIDWGVQRFFDGLRRSVTVTPTWNVSPHLALSGQYSLDAVRFDDRGQGFDAHIARLRIETALDTRLSASALLQYSSVDDLAGANVRMRYNFREGTDLWMVYDEGLRLDLDRIDPRPPRSSRRALLIKYTHRWAR